MVDKVEKWLEKRKQGIADEWEYCIRANIKKCESPIEELFYIEWIYYNPYGKENMPGGYGYYIVPQYNIDDKYRVDFLISYATSGEWWFGNKRENPEKNRSIIIELDSHLWHGATPEQFSKEKERERELQKDGWHVMRFSGREIYKNVEKCVLEIMEYFECKKLKEK